MRAGVRRRSSQLTRLFRAWVAFVALVMTTSSTVAWAMPCLHDASSERDETDDDPCCPDDDSGDDSEEEREGCSCPLDCGPCCAGAPAPAIPAVLPVTPSLVSTYSDLTFPAGPVLFADGSTLDILHIPKR